MVVGPLETDEDRLAILQACGAETIRYAGGEFEGIFNEPYADAGIGTEPPVESLLPWIRARSSDVARLPKGATLRLRDELEYRIVRFEPDGSGATRIVLEEI